MCGGNPYIYYYYYYYTYIYIVVIVVIDNKPELLRNFLIYETNVIVGNGSAEKIDTFLKT